MNFASKLDELREVLAGLDNGEKMKIVSKLKSYLRLEIISAEEIIQKEKVADSFDEHASLVELFSKLSGNITKLGEYGAEKMGKLMAEGAMQILQNAVAEANIRLELSKQVIHPVNTIEIRNKSEDELNDAFRQIKDQFGIDTILGCEISGNQTVLKLSLASDHSVDLAKAVLNIFLKGELEIGLIIHGVKNADVSLKADDGDSVDVVECPVIGCKEMFLSRFEFYLHYFEHHRLYLEHRELYG